MNDPASGADSIEANLFAEGVCDRFDTQNGSDLHCAT